MKRTMKDESIFAKISLETLTGAVIILLDTFSRRSSLALYREVVIEKPVKKGISTIV
ncbi:hypothetical protein PS420_09010 [Pediococcus acidilactici]